MTNFITNSAEINIDALQSRLNAIDHAWKGVIFDYKGAYNTAYIEWQKTMKAQAEADKFMIDLALIGLSLCSGSIMVAAFSGVALKTVVNNKLLDLICKNNMNKAFKAVHWLDHNNTARFIIGSLWDHAKNKANKILKGVTIDTITRVGSKIPEANNLVPNPGVIMPAINSFVSNCAKCADLTFANILESKLNKNKEKEAFILLFSSHYCRPVKQFPDDLAERIELSFYLKMVLNTKVEVNKQVDVTEGLRTLSTKPVGPFHKHPKQRGGQPAGPGHILTSIGYRSVGEKIIERMNKLVKKIFKGKFPDVIDSWCCGERSSQKAIDRAFNILINLDIDNFDHVKKTKGQQTKIT